MVYYGDFESAQAEQAALDHMMEEHAHEDAEREAAWEEECERQSKLNDFISIDKI